MLFRSVIFAGQLFLQGNDGQAYRLHVLWGAPWTTVLQVGQARASVLQRLLGGHSIDTPSLDIDLPDTSHGGSCLLGGPGRP